MYDRRIFGSQQWLSWGFIWVCQNFGFDLESNLSLSLSSKCVMRPILGTSYLKNRHVYTHVFKCIWCTCNFPSISIYIYIQNIYIYICLYVCRMYIFIYTYIYKHIIYIHTFYGIYIYTHSFLVTIYIYIYTWKIPFLTNTFDPSPHFSDSEAKIAARIAGTGDGPKISGSLSVNRFQGLAEVKPL